MILLRPLSRWFWCALIPVAMLSAQGSSGLQLPVAMLSENGEQISAVFSQNVVAVDKGAARLDGTSSTISSLAVSLLEKTVVTVIVNPPITNEKGVRVCFSGVKYTETAPQDATKQDATQQSGTKQNAAKKQLVSTGEICANLTKGAPAARDAALKDAEAAKKSDEKTIFASGLVTTASSGSSGGADISLNPKIGIPGMTSFMDIQKTTQQGGDPKHFEAGARYQAVLPWGRGLIAKMAPLSDPDDMGKLGELLTQQQKKLIAGAVVDVAGKLEGDPTNFGVTNWVMDGNLSVRSATKGFAHKKGYWRGFIIPAAFEGGHNLGAGSTTAATTAPTSTASPATSTASTTPITTQPGPIARLKTGLGMTFFYEDWKSNLPVKRVDLDVNGVGRDLFCKEAMYDPTTKLDDLRGQGIRGYGQVDLKLYLGESDSARYGVKLSYDRGSLPPVFARVSSFQFGFLYETKDDKVAKK
jgi:hypothetical protein